MTGLNAWFEKKDSLPAAFWTSLPELSAYPSPALFPNKQFWQQANCQQVNSLFLTLPSVPLNTTFRFAQQSGRIVRICLPEPPYVAQICHLNVKKAAELIILNPAINHLIIYCSLKLSNEDVPYTFLPASFIKKGVFTCKLEPRHQSSCTGAETSSPWEPTCLPST